MYSLHREIPLFSKRTPEFLCPQLDISSELSFLIHDRPAVLKPPGLSPAISLKQTPSSATSLVLKFGKDKVNIIEPLEQDKEFYENPFSVTLISPRSSSPSPMRSPRSQFSGELFGVWQLVLITHCRADTHEG